MKITIALFVLIPCLLTAQTDYNQLTNWYYHPDKIFNFIESYDLDIAVIGKDLSIQSVIQIENNAGNDTGTDVFWVHPTILNAPPFAPTTIPISDQDEFQISGTILAQGALLAKYGRFFAPKYRQASPGSFLGAIYSDVERANALLETYSDIKAAFVNYLDNHNNGNKIILAGHSQGSFLLAMLLRDVFDNNPQLREQLVTASLGGMGYVYAAPNNFLGGWWENIPLCTLQDECGCVHFWRSYDNIIDLPQPVTSFPSFNQVLVDSGLVFRTTVLANDWLFQDSLFYGTVGSPLRYYIAPEVQYNLATDYNIIAFDSLYTAKLKRESNTEVGLSLEPIEYTNDLRPNDLDSLQSSATFPLGNFHQKDYHIYIWALLEQIDSKLEGCQTTGIHNDFINNRGFLVYPNPSSGTVKIKLIAGNLNPKEGTFIILNTLGQIVKVFEMNSTEKLIHIDIKGIYYIVSGNSYKKIIIN